MTNQQSKRKVEDFEQCERSHGSSPPKQNVFYDDYMDAIIQFQQHINCYRLHCTYMQLLHCIIATNGHKTNICRLQKHAQLHVSSDIVLMTKMMFPNSILETFINSNTDTYKTQHCILNYILLPTNTTS